MVPSKLIMISQDFGRFSSNGFKGPHQFFALPIIGTLGALTPIFVTSAHSVIWGNFQWYMPAVIEDFDSRAAKFFVAFSFMLATIGNQVAAGMHKSCPRGYAISNMNAHRYLPLQ